MPTKYDVFAKLIEKSPSSESQLEFKNRVSIQLKELTKLNWIKETNKTFTPIKNEQTTHAFNIIKYCLKNNLDYNLFFSRNMPTILKELIRNTPQLRPTKLKNNKDILEILKYLENNQFILSYSKKPAKGSLLRHQLLENIFLLHKEKLPIPKPNFSNETVKEKVMKIKGMSVNPFDETIFAFLAGSAQLEGATISIGETRDLLVNNIYPDKPQKDVQMVKNLNEALHHILEHHDEDITQEHIKQINYLVMFSMHRNAGKYKKIQNKIKGNPHFKPAKPQEVELLMKKYCETVKKITPKNCLKQIGYIHNELQHIHPFSDGNSRTTRMILNWIMIQNNLPLIILKMGCFDEYMNLTKLSKQRDDNELKELFWNLLVHENINN